MIDNKKYPEIYFSSPVRSRLDKTPPIPSAPIEPKKPIKPVAPPSKKEGLGCLVIFVIGGIAAVISVISSSDFDIEAFFAVFGFGVSVFMLIFFSILDVKSEKQDRLQYEEDEKRYPVLLEKYKKSYQEYLTRKDIYDAQIEKIMSPSNLTRYRQEMIMSWLKVRERPQFMSFNDSDVVKKGVSEKYFMNLLSKRYEVLDNQKIPVGAKYYYPDIIIICDNLYIDIEIDEPYVGSDGSPIHYLEEEYGLLFSVDIKRNDYMINHGWEVIRFSEEQIFLHTEECIKIVDNVISAIKEGKDQFEIPSSMVTPKWTKEQSSKLAYQRFRNTYIPRRYLAYIESETSKSYVEIEQAHTISRLTSTNMTSFSDAQSKNRNNITNIRNKYDSAAHNWVEVDSQKLSDEVMANITDCRIKQGLYGKVLCFTMKDGSARLANWSNQAPDYPAGTIIAPESVTLVRLQDKMTDDWVLRASGEAL